MMPAVMRPFAALVVFLLCALPPAGAQRPPVSAGEASAGEESASQDTVAALEPFVAR